jgi:superoxide reductase
MLSVYHCSLCGNLQAYLAPQAKAPVCCGQNMDLLKANSVDAAKEKHVPVVEVKGNKVMVKVGSVEHPMLENHYIQYIILETSKKAVKFELKPGNKPEHEFVLEKGEKAVAAYEYCTLHGLWMAEIK